MAKEKAARKTLKEKKDKKEKKGRITKKGKALLKKELEKIEQQKQAGISEMMSLTRTDRRQKKKAEKLRKKIIEHFERETMMAAVANMKLGVPKGSPEKLKTRAALDAAMAKEAEVKAMDWRDLLDKYADEDWARADDQEETEEYVSIKSANE